MYQSGNENGNYANQITNGGNSFILREYLNFDRFEMNANGDCELHTMIDERGNTSVGLCTQTDCYIVAVQGKLCVS